MDKKNVHQDLKI